MTKHLRQESRTANSRFAKAGVSKVYIKFTEAWKSKIQLIHLGKRPALRKAAER